jgi:hypothetical protein
MSVNSSSRPTLAGAPGARWGLVLAATLAGAWTLRLAAAAQPHCFLDWVNLPFHEAGHLFLAPFGRLLHFLGGTLMQLVVPALLAASFLKRRSPFSASACLWWLGESLLNVSVYMGDARDLRLELVGGGEHDWNEIFYRLGLLDQDSVAGISMIVLALPERIRRGLEAGISSRFPVAALLFEGSE